MRNVNVRFRRPQNTNTVVAVFLLILLAVLVGQSNRFIASIVPGADEGGPCEWLRQANNRAAHQSLLGRSALHPIVLGINTSSVPAIADGELVTRITIGNVSLGTVPIIYNPNQVQIGDAGFNTGLGIVINPTGPVPEGATQAGAFVPESDIRLLGPRQRCVHTMRFLTSQLPDPSLGTGNATVKAYYRNTSTGVTQSQDPLATPIFTDQGLWVGVVESPVVSVPVAASP
jgi:hypothetical protein